MNPRLLRIRAILLLIAGLVMAVVVMARRAHAQGAPSAAAAPAQATPTGAFALQGAVVDPAGKPVPEQKLTLHRVASDGSGAMVDSATSDARGHFTVHVPAERDTSAVYFVATRWQGQLYIGSPFKPPVPAGAAYSVVVGVNPVNMGPVAGGAGGEGGSAAAGAPGQAAPASSDSSTAARWFLAVILALVALGAIAYALLAAARERERERRRELLARIAALDERADRAAGEEAARLERQRAELLAELSSD